MKGLATGGWGLAGRSRTAWIVMIAFLAALAGGCDRLQGEATRDAAHCEDLRSRKEFAAAVPVCRVEVEKGCAAYGSTAAFCGLAHVHLGLALAGTGDQVDLAQAGKEVETGGRILCAAGSSWQTECAMAQSLKERFDLRSPPS
jgi:hypothetical protein